MEVVSRKGVYGNGRLSGDGRKECLSENVMRTASVEVEESWHQMGVDEQGGCLKRE